MGGLPSLGYDVQNRKLVVNDEEALTVLHIFRRYIQLRSVRALQPNLMPRGSGASGGRWRTAPLWRQKIVPRRPLSDAPETASIGVRSRTKGMPILESIRQLSTSHCRIRSGQFLLRTGSIGHGDRMQSTPASS